MDYRCPVCGADLGERKTIHAIVVRMEKECSHCRSRIQLNVHWTEEIVVLLSFGTVVALAAFAYRFHSQSLVLAALGAAMLGALALPLLEQTYLRTWPRYVPSVPRPNP